jgi:hypothetical protein
VLQVQLYRERTGEGQRGEHRGSVDAADDQCEGA